ncbi:MAG TPA: DEAD/DEAH box helicase [Thermoanaerobaculia bacterium]|nr:DEAD/DEAH box helicase [Thermoanaerobaculia bacterium]
MDSNDLLDLLRLLVTLPTTVFWPAVAWALDRLRGIGGLASGSIALVLLGATAGLAFLWQRRLIGLLDGAPATPIGPLTFLKLELLYSPLGLPLWLVRLPRMALRSMVRGIRSLVARLRPRRKPPGGETASISMATARGPASSPPPALLVASLGPGYLLAGLVTAGLYVAAAASAPLVRRYLELSPGASSWQFLFLGRRAELGWYLPLSRFPFLGALLCLLLWLAIWAVVGIVIRFLLHRHLARNLVADRDREEVLPFWRRWCGTPFLARPAPSFREWAGWLAVAACPLLLWAWFSLDGDPYRLPGSQLAVALVLWTSWCLHLVLGGEDRPPQAAVHEPEPAVGRGFGWFDVLALLESRCGVSRPEPRETRPLEPLSKSDADLSTAGVLSPLVLELLAGAPPSQLTPMQRSVLTQLALQGYVHVDPPVSRRELTLSASPELDPESGHRRQRNLIVLAPEGAGKSTLALLAAANHALVHTRGTLVIVRSDEAAERLAARFRRSIEPSTLRWNVRVRQPGRDLMIDLAQGIIPDVVVCSLHDLVTTVLDRADTFAPLLSTLGLVIVDDVEAFAGPVEVHAQLAFGRLTLRLRELTGVRTLGETSAPQMLILGAESMHRMPDWVRSLCGVEAVVRTYSQSAREASERERAELLASGTARLPPEAERDGSRAAASAAPPATEAEEQARPAAAEAGAVAPGATSAASEPTSPAPTASTPEHGAATTAAQLCYRLGDFRRTVGPPLVLAEVVEACEQLAVPWHYRLCGDGRRDLGRGPLLLREEPVSYRESPEEACVVLLEGSWSEVRREQQRLRRAGARFRRSGQADAREAGEPIAVITLVERDQEEVFDLPVDSPDLAEKAASLPWPFVRPPTGVTVEPHLSADLTQHWLEVKDVVTAFGGACVPRLRRLADHRLLLSERRIDVAERANEYVENVYVHALAAAVTSDDGESDPEAGLLPPKVAQVELAVASTVPVRDRTRLTVLANTPAETAHVGYYPGRIFHDARGIFVTVGRAGDDASRSATPAGAVLVEPLLTDDVSSPRRLFLVASSAHPSNAAEVASAAAGSSSSNGRVLFGRHPFVAALGQVTVRTRLVATYRLDSVQRQIRQRTLHDDPTRQRYEAPSFETIGLAIFPNPEVGSTESDSTDPVAATGALLSFEGARLFAAVLRLILPTMYRGARDGVAVALTMRDGAGSEGERALLPGEGIYLLDADPGGNAMSHTIRRDGLELLLRLCRLALERATDLERLRALYDEWGSEDEVLAESCGGAGSFVDDQRARANALAWLDSRLRSEAEISGARGW